MSNLRRFLSILVVLAVVFAFLACKDDEEETSGSSASLGSTLSLSGQVYTWDGSTNYTQFTGDKVISAVYWDAVSGSYKTITGGTGGITNGQFTYSIGTPSPLLDITVITSDENLVYRVSKTEAKGITLDFQTTADSSFWKGNSTSTIGEAVQYFYVDRDVTISVDRTVWTREDNQVTYTFTMNAFSINLKTGWNAIYHKEVETPANHFTATISAANPDNLRWILYEW